MENSKAKRQSLTIPVNFEQPLKEPVPLTAFLFMRDGRLVQQVPVEKDAATFKEAPARGLGDVRVFIAPTPKERAFQVTSVADMERLHAYEPLLDLDDKGKLQVLPVPEYLSKWWCFAFCRVRGSVTKNFVMDGMQQNRPVCNARVHICEVDKIWWLLLRIPDEIILRIPEIVLNPELPIPLPHPIPDPSPVEGTADIFGRFQAKAYPKPTSSVLSATAAATISKSAAIHDEVSAAQPRTSATIREAATNIRGDIKQLLLSGNSAQIREVIAQNFYLFHPFFCWLPWIWPYFYRCDEIITVTTDMNGHFDTSIFYWGCGDHPDLYFWVECFIDGVWTTVYKPPVPCHTYWNFACGSEVTINITDPRVRWGCNTVIEGDIVWIKTIGHGASIAHIQQTDLYSIIQNVSFNRIGLSDVSVPHRGNSVGDFRRPFGSQLYFLLQFGSGLPAGGMSYYRWSYRKTRNADLSIATGPLTILNNELFKSYSFEYYDVLMHKHIDYKSFRLGPVTVGSTNDLFIIPPVSPTQAPVNAVEMSPDWDQNTVSVTFDSSKLDDGLYEFILEIFDGAGNKVTGLPRQLFQTPSYSSFAPSVDAPDDNLILSSTTQADAFHMNVRIDNQKCEADIYKILVDGAETSANCCGFVKYQPGSAVELRLRGYHPHNFADFSFVVQKGTCIDPTQTNATNTSGMVIGSTYNGTVENYHRSIASVYSKSFTPATLLGTCAGDGKAAFAESLGVAVLTTDGNEYLELDASALAAFALEPA
ncbi:MAG TPA: hypothetical protein VFX43_02605 [Chitinophagaceae bacterium]|nr:hypothetical protein [Chitinophagaceae bacterium]